MGRHPVIDLPPTPEQVCHEHGHRWRPILMGHSTCLRCGITLGEHRHVPTPEDLQRLVYGQEEAAA